MHGERRKGSLAVQALHHAVLYVEELVPVAECAVDFDGIGGRTQGPVQQPLDTGKDHGCHHQAHDRAFQEGWLGSRHRDSGK